LTIQDRSSSPDDAVIDPQTLILAALGWILDNEARAQRFLSLTGLDPDALRSGLTDPQVLIAVIEFLENHEPDLVRAAEALAVTPEQLTGAARELRA